MAGGEQSGRADGLIICYLLGALTPCGTARHHDSLHWSIHVLFRELICDADSSTLVPVPAAWLNLPVEHGAVTTQVAFESMTPIELRIVLAPVNKVAVQLLHPDVGMSV